MKSGNSHRSKGIKVSVTIISLICLTLVLLIWEKTPPIAVLAPAGNLDVLPPGRTIMVNPVKHIEDENKQPNLEQNPLHVVRPQYLTDKNTNGVSALPPVDFPQQKTLDDQNSTKLHMKEKGCNYAKGKWVEDKRRPLYSGFECKRWLSSMWACKLMKRQDFSYEGYRWQPESCEMPDFENSEFLKRMQNKTIALVGDSLGRQQFQSLMCMVTGGKEIPEVEDVGWEYGLAKAPGALRPDGWAYRFQRTNTTILYYWSASLCELEPLNRSDPATHYAMHLDRPATFLKQYLHRFDALVLNTGHHWNRGKFQANRWLMYVSGKPNTDRKLAEIGKAKSFTVYSVVNWLDSQLVQYPKLKAFFRSISPRHFVNGDWNTGGSCDNTIPLSSGSEVSQDISSDFIAEGAVKGTRVKLLDITAISDLRNEGHISRYSLKSASGIHDCLHWCLPGIPDTWNEILCAQL